LAVAEEQVRTLTEELRTARTANVQQNERVDKLRWLSNDLKKKYDALGGDAKTSAQKQELLQNKLREETARRQAAEAEIERLRQNLASAKSEEPESQEMDADFIADLRKDIQAAMKAAAPNRVTVIAPAKAG
jgi:chromosome segregation ATPase